MGKLIKGLIAAAIPVAVIVGIASCGHRPVVMTSATNESWAYYSYECYIPETYPQRITNQIATAVGSTINATEQTGNDGQLYSTHKNTFAYLKSFNYGWSSLGYFQIQPHTMVWEVWDGSAYTSNAIFKSCLDEYKEYFLYAYASDGSNLYEYGYPSIWQYNASNEPAVQMVSLRYNSDGNLIRYGFPAGTSTLKVENDKLSNYLMNVVRQYAYQAEAPQIDNGEAYEAGRAQGYNEGYQEGINDASNGAYDDGYAEGHYAGYNEGYRAGQNSVSDETTAINNLFASLVSVPINVLNGLMPMAVWNTPIIGMMVTFMLLAMLMWLIRKLLAR